MLEIQQAVDLTYRLFDYGRPRELHRAQSAVTYAVQDGERTGIASVLRQLAAQGIDFKDLHSSETSLEEIFVDLVRESP